MRSLDNAVMPQHLNKLNWFETRSSETRGLGFSRRQPNMFRGEKKRLYPSSVDPARP